MVSKNVLQIQNMIWKSCLVCTGKCIILYYFSLKKIPIYLGHSNHIQDHEQQAYSNHYNNNEIKNNFVQDCENFKFPILQDFYDQQIIADETISDVTSTKRRK